jgi:pimeloyl-ACP methyl ester carboxylesterase
MRAHLLRNACMAGLLAGCQAVTQAPSTRTMDVGGAALAYVDQGNGIPVVLVHAALLDHRIWDPLREPLSRTYRFVAVDQGARMIVAPGQRHLWPINDPRSFEAALRAFLANS